jgi:acetyl esterase/lipase
MIASALVAGAVSAACAGSDVGVSSPGASGPQFAATEDYLPGVAADIYLPDQFDPAATIVLVPGGAWQTADRSGLAPLSEALARSGLAVVNATYRAAAAGEVFPVPVQDVSCAAAFSAHWVKAAGRRSGPVVLLGHSSGAHLAAIAALADNAPGSTCPFPPIAISGLIGLAGPYDVAAVPDLAISLFGTSRDKAPDLWRQGNPLTWVDRRPALPVLLLHGDKDELVPLTFTKEFAAALRNGGHPVQLEIVAQAGHDDVYSPRAVAEIIIDWMRGTYAETARGTSTGQSFSRPNGAMPRHRGNFAKGMSRSSP